MNYYFKKSQLSTFIPFLFFCLFLSKSWAQPKSTPLPLGEIIDTVRCLHAPAMSYAAYLPSSYDASKGSPIIYFFEPMARGRLPLELYAEIAESKGYILICSNNSRNGLVSENIKWFDSLQSDVDQRFSIAKDRVYTSGFSGGARFAHHLASTRDNIAGVIAVAGPKLDQAAISSSKYYYFGIVGTRDMNYIEHKVFQNTLSQQGIKNMLLTYPGPHQWAPEFAFMAAVNWLDIQYQISNRLKNSETLVKTYTLQTIRDIDTTESLSSTEKYIYLNSLRMTMSPFEFPLLDFKIKELENDKRLFKTIRKEGTLLQKESDSYKEFFTALYELKVNAYSSNPKDSITYSMSWWDQKIKDLKNRADRTDRKGDVAARKLDVIRGQVFGVILQTEVVSNPRYQLGLYKIQQMLYPESIRILWKLAVNHALNEDKRSALSCIKKADKIDDHQLASLRKENSEMSQRFPYLFE